MTYRFVPHTADIKVAIQGKKMEDLFHDGLALIRELTAGASEVTPTESRQLDLTAPAPDELLLQFLKELVYWFATDAFVPAALEIESLDRDHLRAEVRGEAFDPSRHEAQPEVKAVTRHQLHVDEEKGRWQAEVVFDL